MWTCAAFACAEHTYTCVCCVYGLKLMRLAQLCPLKKQLSTKWSWCHAPHEDKDFGKAWHRSVREYLESYTILTPLTPCQICRGGTTRQRKLSQACCVRCGTSGEMACRYVTDQRCGRLVTRKFGRQVQDRHPGAVKWRGDGRRRALEGPGRGWQLPAREKPAIAVCGRAPSSDGTAALHRLSQHERHFYGALRQIGILA